MHRIVCRSVDVALKFDSIDVATTMSRAPRRQMMVAKENETKTPRPQMWINVHFDNSLSFLSLNFFASTCSHFYFYFSAFFLYTSNNITNISVRTTQMRAHMHTYDRSSYSSCTFFFYVNKKLFSVALVSLSRLFFFLLYVCTCA